eukprot:1206363-Prymnesium_polylepis.5
MPEELRSRAGTRLFFCRHFANIDFLKDRPPFSLTLKNYVHAYTCPENVKHTSIQTPGSRLLLLKVCVDRAESGVTVVDRFSPPALGSNATFSIICQEFLTARDATNDLKRTALAIQEKCASAKFSDDARDGMK